jgi:hypothetical protein
MVRASHIVTAVIALLMILPGMAWGFDDEGSRETLRGIKGVRVVVESIEPEIEEAGLTRSQVQTDVELKLRTAGLNLLTPEERNKEIIRASGGAYLYVNPHILKLHKIPSYFQVDVYVFSIDLEFYQAVYLMRNKKRAAALTWSTGVLGTNRDLGKIRSEIKDRVDVFLDAWLSVNPK